MTPFYGNYDVTVDDKNRMLVPADIRRVIDPEVDGKTLYVLHGLNRKLWLYTEKQYVALSAQLSVPMAAQGFEVQFQQWYFGTAHNLEWDKQGRILIPERMVQKAGLQRDVTVVGMKDHVEIWNRADWAAQEAEIDRKQEQIAEMLRKHLDQQQRTAPNP